MKEEVKKEIDGFDYTFYQLGALKSHSLLLKIGKIVGPAFGAMANSQGEDEKGLSSLLDSKIDLQKVIEELMERADEKVIESIITTLGSQIHYTDNDDDGGVLNNNTIIDQHFKGRLQSMYKVLYAALEVQYSDFLGEGGILANIQTKAKGSSRKK